jgi:hypothetical protein
VQDSIWVSIDRVASGGLDVGKEGRRFAARRGKNGGAEVELNGRVELSDQCPRTRHEGNSKGGCFLFCAHDIVLCRRDSLVWLVQLSSGQIS